MKSMIKGMVLHQNILKCIVKLIIMVFHVNVDLTQTMKTVGLVSESNR